MPASSGAAVLLRHCTTRLLHAANVRGITDACERVTRMPAKVPIPGRAAPP